MILLSKKTFSVLQELHNNGFRNWYSSVCEIALHYDLNIHSLLFNEATKKQIKFHIKSHFIRAWMCDLQNVTKYPSLRTYRVIKKEFRCEPYLSIVKKDKFRSALSRFRASSHILEIERGRYTKPKTPPEKRFCIKCRDHIEDEYHFMMVCEIYTNERQLLFSKINDSNLEFSSLDNYSKFTFLFNNDDPKILSWVGRFIYNCMILRVIFHEN